jgi:hypothetical protein
MWIFMIRKKMFKSSSNFMGMVLKMTQLHEYHFPQTLLNYFMHM